MKEMGEYLIIKKTDFEKYKNAYDKYEQKKESARNYMRKKYNEEKLRKQNEKIEEYPDPYLDPEFLFQIEHVS